MPPLRIGEISVTFINEIVNRQLSDILKKAPHFSEEDARQLMEWASQYPYSQVLHTATACASVFLSRPDQQERVQQAAIYSTNRSVLKALVEVSLLAAQQYKLYPSESQATMVPSSDADEDLADRVLAEIKHLKEARLRFEQVANAMDKSPDQKRRRTGTKQHTRQQSDESDNFSKTDIKSRRRSRKSEKAPTDKILEEIESKRQPIAPQNEKAREQMEIIDRYLQNQSSSSSPPNSITVQRPAELDRLHQDFSEHIISETLVDILIQQGKKDKAIDVLKKLIWKFPQKKTYFADRIEELKK